MRLQNRLKAAGPCKPGQTAASGCTPASGAGGGSKPSNSLSGKVRQAASAVAQGFLKATSAYAKAADTAKRFKSAGFDKLPPSGQRAVTKVWGAAKYVEHKMMTAMRVGKEAAVQAAKERGLSPEKTERLAKILGTADMVSAWTVNFPATVAVTGSAAAGKLASFLPVASLSYLAYSTARNPMATVRAAKAVMKSQGAGHGHKSVRKSADREELATLLASTLDGLNEESLDWFSALLSAAMDASPDDPAAAVEAATRAFRSSGKPPAGADADLSEKDGALLAGADSTSLENRLKPAGGGQKSGKLPKLVKKGEDEEDEEVDPAEAAPLIADILYGIFGEEALAIFEQDSEDDKKRSGSQVRKGKGEWNELAHPRGKGGKFIKRGSGEALDAAVNTIEQVLRGDKVEAPAEKVSEFLNILNVKQLKELHKKYGKKAPGKLRADLVQSVMSRLEPKEADREQPEAEGAGEQPETESGTETPAGEGDGGPGGGEGPGDAATGGEPLEGGPERPGDEGGDRGGEAGGESDGVTATRAAARKRAAAKVEKVNQRLNRYEKMFSSRGMGEVAGWMAKIREHVAQFGVESALESLGEDLGEGDGKETQYAGAWEEDDGSWSFSDFVGDYLSRHGINLIHSTEAPSPDTNLVSPSTAPRPDRTGPGDYVPVNQTLDNKLVEAQKLPGLERSEDLSKLIGSKVTHLTPDVMTKLDEHYGPGKWIVKSYSESAYAGFGIYFPQRAQQITKDARDAVWNSGGGLAQYGFSHLRDDAGKIVGIKHTGGEEYLFGTDKYNSTIGGDARHWADMAASAAPNERGASLPMDGEEFMVQPAFAAVGVSDADRAAGRTIAPGEGRVHIITRNGKAEIIPHTTWIKGEHLPVVFESEETKAMAKAALDAINALPESERQGQVYGPDILKSKDGYRVVEANPSNEAGGSGYMGDNPFIIDSYVSHVTKRSPAHVRFIRRLLTDRAREEAL